MDNINFFEEEVNFQLPNAIETASWISEIIAQERARISDLNYIFCSDNYLHNINLTYLHHDTLTDIITFDHSEEAGVITGDVFISIERVKENAKEQNNTFDEELHRVIIHGALHLLGYDDKNDEQKQSMRKKEAACLSLR